MIIPDFLQRLAIEPEVTWSIATFGAIAEFSHATHEHIDTAIEQEQLTVISPRGALQFQLDPNACIVAYEGLSKNPVLWSQGVSICLPEPETPMCTVSSLTEIGSDEGAVQGCDRTGILFDIGIGAPHMRACIRTSDRDLISALREHAGKELFGADAAALHHILMANPDRVFSSNLGRVEVKTPIAGEYGSTTPGPHTHVLPDLLTHKRTHAANVPIPDGYVPCLNVFPPNSARDGRGNARTFDIDAHTAFQEILSDHGDPVANHIKQMVIRNLTMGLGPDSIEQPRNRVERTALRVALRQFPLSHGESKELDAWRSVYEPNEGKSRQSG